MKEMEGWYYEIKYICSQLVTMNKVNETLNNSFIDAESILTDTQMIKQETNAVVKKETFSRESTYNLELVLEGFKMSFFEIKGLEGNLDLNMNESKICRKDVNKDGKVETYTEANFGNISIDHSMERCGLITTTMANDNKKYLMEMKIVSNDDGSDVDVQINQARIFYSLRYLHSIMAILRFLIPSWDISLEDEFKDLNKRKKLEETALANQPKNISLYNININLL